MKRWAKFLLKALALTMITLIVGGIVYEQLGERRDRQRFSQVGRSVDIGGRSLNIHCSGEGSPTVILEGAIGYEWTPVQHEIAKFTHVCWYDRAGSGWSDLGPYPRDSTSQVRDLHALLHAAQVPPPYVLVGESSAGLDARVYTGIYPTEVAGLVLVNWADPALFLNPRFSNGKRAEQIPQIIYHSQDAAAQLFNGVGLYRLGRVPAAPPPPQGLTAAEWNTIWFLTHSSKALSALMQDIASWRLSSEESRTAGSLGGRPLLVLSAEHLAAPPEFLEAWTNAQSDLARLSTRGRQIAVGGGASDLLYDAPDTIVEAVRGVVAEVRVPNN